MAGGMMPADAINYQKPLNGGGIGAAGGRPPLAPANIVYDFGAQSAVGLNRMYGSPPRLRVSIVIVYYGEWQCSSLLWC